MPAQQPAGFSFPPPGWPSNTMSPTRSNAVQPPPPHPQQQYHYPPPPQFNPTHIPPHTYHYPQSQQPFILPSSSHHATYAFPPNPTHAPPQSYPTSTSYAPPTHNPNTAYPSSGGSYRGNYAQATPTRTAHQQPPPPMYANHARQSNGHVPTSRHLAGGHPSAPTQAPTPAAAVYRHPGSHPPGPLPFFLPPPGQPTSDPSLSTPPTSQALYTTYPSRLRTGVTGLIQPEHITGGPREREYFLAEMEREMNTAGRGGSGTGTPRYDSPVPATAGGGGGGRRSTAAAAALLSGRRGRVVNYAEKASDDEEDDDEDESELSDLDEPASDPEDETFGHRGPVKRGPGRPRKDRGDSAMFGGAGADHQAATKSSKLRRKKEEMERGWTWLGDRTPGERVRSQLARGTKHDYKSEELLEKEADRPEILIPITIDLDVASPNPDHQGIKIKDRFLWNVNEPFIDSMRFSETFCVDVGIPIHPYANVISELIKAQVEEHQNVAEIDISNEDVTEEDVVFSDEEEVEDAMDVGGDAEADEENGEVEDGDAEAEVDAEAEAEAEEGDKDVQEVQKDRRRAREREPEQVWEEADCRIIVNLDVQIYSHILRDRIEWDLSSPLPPSIFAKHYCTELGLTGEAIPLVAFAIHEELLKHKRDALELELFASTHPEEQAKWERGGPLPRVNTKRGAKGLVGVWRDWWEKEEFGPILVEMTMEEMEKREYERTREARRMMRTLTTNKRRR
ncbi:hypothetical protein CI109_102596 [Kwoniella shandongensis]|uniref:Chromatin structure-remodeling complex subunit SFH1 n=1 Tax=Kwoniella shandongensis TaxID=1734106 RepID=A0A5M6BU77_9TREE|nr:uncharacterized protein CI109_005177 [Kwoniella shandongensis]KAA5526408.1 hypothetical protein CI109_005177 [Kwoniella shandongensis]